MRNVRVVLLATLAAAFIVAPTWGQPTEFLLIPESSNDTVGMYDPFDGTYLGQFTTVPLVYGSSSTPINAVLGPDGLVYVSDQVHDAVFRFDAAGAFVDVFADGSDGLNNIRGIDFRGDHLFVTSGDDYVAEFDAAGNRLTDFINDGSDPFDILFLADGSSLLADIQGTTDNVRHYNPDGTLNQQVFSVSFPEQIQFDAQAPGDFLNASFSDNVITDFDLDGTIHSQIVFGGGRGIYRLGNGNLLATDGGGVWELDPSNGSVIEQESSGSARFIEFVPEPGAIVLLALGGLAALRRR